MNKLSKLKKASISLVLLSCFAVTSKVIAIEEQIVATGLHNGRIKIWDINKPDRQENICTISPRSNRAIKKVKFSPINKNMLAFYIKESNYISIWDISDRSNPILIDNLTGHTNDVTCIEFSKHENILASGSKDGTIRIWDLERQGDKCINTITFDQANNRIYPTLLKFNPADKNMLVAAGSGTIAGPDVMISTIWIKTWNIRIQNAQPDRIINERTIYIPESLEFDPFNTDILLLSFYSWLASWDLSKNPGTERLETRHLGLLRLASFNPFKQNSIACSNDTQIFMQKISTEENSTTENMNPIEIYDGIRILKFSPYKRNILVTITPDNFSVLDISEQNDKIKKTLDTQSVVTSIDFMKIEEPKEEKEFKTNIMGKKARKFYDTRINCINE